MITANEIIPTSKAIEAIKAYGVKHISIDGSNPEEWASDEVCDSLLDEDYEGSFFRVVVNYTAVELHLISPLADMDEAENDHRVVISLENLKGECNGFEWVISK